MPSFSKVANGNIPPCRFVKLDTSAADKVLVCGAGESPYGVSGPGVRNVPGDIGLDDGYHAIAGHNCLVFGPPEKDVLLEAGGTITIGALLKSGAAGVAVATVTNLDIVGAIAMQAGVAGDLIRVQLIPPTGLST